jgi:hypothetical protein
MEILRKVSLLQLTWKVQYTEDRYRMELAWEHALDQCSATGVPRHTGVPSQGEMCDANFYLLQEILFNDNKITV